MADLLGGTSGQILSKNSNTDMDFTWIDNQVGDITSITATSPLTGGGTGGDVTVGIQAASTTQSGAVQLTDSTSSTSTTTAATPNSVKSAYDLASTASTTATAAIPKSTVTTAGDVIYATGSSAVTRLGIGSTGQVLTVSGGVPTWATASSGGMTLINTGGTALSGSSVSIGSIPSTYTNLYMIIVGFKPATNTTDIRMTFNNSTSSYSWSATGGTGTFNQPSAKLTDGGQSSSNDNSLISVEIPSYANSTTWKFGNSNALSSNAASSSGWLITRYMAVWNGTSSISSIQLVPSAGNFTSGTAYVFGVK